MRDLDCSTAVSAVILGGDHRATDSRLAKSMLNILLMHLVSDAPNKVQSQDDQTLHQFAKRWCVFFEQILGPTV